MRRIVRSALILATSAMVSSCAANPVSSAGAPEPAASGSVKPAESASVKPAVPQLLAPEGLALGPDGLLYVSDFEGNYIFRVEGDGELTVVAGNGTSGYSGDGGPAIEAQLREPAGIGFDANGNLYIVDHHGNRLRMVDVEGNISTVAGGGQPANGNGDGGPAVDAELNGPIDVAFDLEGRILITDALAHRIRQIDADGVITTIAGTGQTAPHGAGPPGDGEPAINSPITFPWYVAIAPSGDIFVALSDRHRMYRIDPAGVLHLVAGTGEIGSTGDGGPAVDATLNWPNGVAIGPDGSAYVSEGEGHRVRRIGPDGVISTVAGTGKAGFVGDGGPATDAQLDRPFGLAIDADGNLYVADGNNGRVRMIDGSGVIRTVAGG